MEDSENRLCQYIEAAKDSSSAARPIILKILQDPEILEGFTSCKSLTDDAKLRNTLDLFSFGTLSEYQAQPDSFLVLTDLQLQKLSQLTVVSLLQAAARSHQRQVPYADLKLSPDASQKQIEQLLLSLLSLQAIRGKLDQKSKCFWLTAIVRPRDVRDPAELLASIQGLRTKLTGAQTRLSEKRDSLETILNQLNVSAVEDHEDDPRQSKRTRVGMASA